MNDDDMTTIRIRQSQRALLVEVSSRIAIATGTSCSMTMALDMLLDYLKRHHTAKQLADLLLDERA